MADTTITQTPLSLLSSPRGSSPNLELRILNPIPEEFRPPAICIPERMVSISLERLQKLEELENSLPAMIEQAIQENKKKNLSRLHEKDKQNPESVNLRVKRYAARHKETLNARRRAKREQKKKAQQENNNHVVYPDASAPAGGSPIPAANFATLVPHLDVITVRFDN